MTKHKNKAAKKKFFKRKDNRGKVFKKAEKPPEAAIPKLRERGRFQLIEELGGIDVPMCSHGPCLLFEDKKEGMRYFSCAIYRGDAEKCDYKGVVEADGTVNKASVGDVVPVKATYEYGSIPAKLKTIPKESKIVYCPTCNDVIFADKHKHPGEFVKRAILRRPSTVLAALDEQHGMAQYFFAPSSLALIASTIDATKYDGVLCLGSPRLHETLLAEKKEGRTHFMLDWDERYLPFYAASACARYSMLVDYFPDKKAQRRLEKWMAGVSRLLIVCDPPFGVFVEPLVRNIELMRQRHRSARADQPATSNSLLFLPVFVGKHALKTYNGELWMSDYRVLYDNHKDFAKRGKTIVRIFTDLSKDAIDLSEEEGYRFCAMCEKWVDNDNVHCGMCGDCPSRDGQPMKHCPLCMRCAKASYRHCRQCSRCHLAGRCPIELEKEAEKAKIAAEKWRQEEEERKKKEKAEKLEAALERKRLRAEERVKEEEDEDEEEDEEMEEDEEEEEDE